MISDADQVRSTGIGSWPGADIADAVAIAFAECPELPYIPELPMRGEYAQLVGRSTALLAGLAVDLQPAGWRLTGGSGRDHRLAKATLRADLDHVEERAQGYVGPLKFSVAGPWTLTASMERPRGDRVLADHGARRELAQSLAEGIGQLIEELARRLPDVQLLLQLDEPSLPAILDGRVPTASGFSRHRAVDRPEVSAGIEFVVESARGRGVETWVHCCAADPPIDLLRRSGVTGMLVDLDQLVTRDWDVIGPAIEDGMFFGLGVLPTGRTATGDQLAARSLRALRALGVDPGHSGQLFLTPACGLATAAPAQAVAALRGLHKAAEIVTEQLAD